MQTVHRSPLSATLEEPDFTLLDPQTKVRLLLDKAVRYERLLLDLARLLGGDLPQQMQFRVGGTPCTFTCANRRARDGGPHNAGTERACKACAVYMARVVSERLEEAGFL